jgi:hypothetical protein
MRTLLTDQKAERMAHGAWYTAGIVLLVAGFTACSPQKVVEKTLQDQPLSAFQTNLLQTAFDIASAIPGYPHIKDRSRAQETVVDACLTLDQPQRALGYIEKIGNWRKGLGYANVAFYSAQHGVTNNVVIWLKYADEISLRAEQEWRRDRVKVRIAQTHLLLGQNERAGRWVQDIEKSESGKVAQVSAQIGEIDSFSNQLSQVNELVKLTDIDVTKNAMNVCLTLYERFYDRPILREEAEQKVKNSWNSLPYLFRIDYLLGLARIAVQHSDFEIGLRLTDEAKTMTDSQTWPPEYEIPLRAKIGGLRAQCGDVETAISELNEVATHYEEKRADITDIDRAETLIPLAEAFLTANQSVRASDVYSRALEESVVNPNSRP